MMLRAVLIVTAMLCVQTALAEQRSPAETSELANEALLRELESRYQACIAAAQRGDLDTYLRLRTETSRHRPPTLDAQRIRLLAVLLPPLSTLDFVRLDANDRTARALYRWRKGDAAQYSVLVFRVEQGEWKLDDFSVRRTPVSAARAAAHATPPAAAAPASALRDSDPPTQSEQLLRNWQSGRPDPLRQLDAPRL